MSDIELESPPVDEPTQLTGVGRRRLLRAGVAAAPVMLALSGRSAMAATCPPTMSAPTQRSLDPGMTENCIVSSHHPETAGSARPGFAPAFWTPKPVGQTFQPPYPWSVSPFTKLTIARKSYSWNPSSYLYYKDIASNDPCWATGVKFNNVFTSSFDKRSFSRILLDDAGSLNGHFCAAYLNARAMSGAYAMTVKEVLTIASTWCLVPGSPVLSEGQLKAFLSQTWA